MSNFEFQKSRFLDELKSNYRKRIQEVDTLSKHFSSSSSDFRSQCLSGMLDILQYCVDLQKKFTADLPFGNSNDLIIMQSKMITEAWIRTLQNIDLFYSNLVEYATNNMRLYNQGLIQVMQTVENSYDRYENFPRIEKNTLVKIIKEAKKVNDSQVQQELSSLKDVNDSKRPKKSTISKH